MAADESEPVVRDRRSQIGYARDQQLALEQTTMDLAEDVTIVNVTHNLQQAQRVSNQCAFFLAEAGTPG